MSGNKSPSVSGFTKEFFHRFWDKLGDLVTSYINDAFEVGLLFHTQRRGIITLIPKKGDQKQLKNKRPICLLDVVYKIIAKVLAMRLAKVIQDLISCDQNGFIKGRNIRDNLRIIQDVIDYTIIDKNSGILCALDFRAAFNSLEHDFIFNMLKRFNFGPDFVRWVQLLYNQTELTIINNGFISDWFTPKRGIMQGCPLSGMLFALAVETLAIKIRASDKMVGIRISGVEVKLSQYADDTTVFARDQESVQELIMILDEFSEASGLELNLNKTKFMWLGRNRASTQTVCGILPSEKVKILGVWFSASLPCLDDNLEPILHSIKVVLNMWSERHLSIKGRITVSKSLAISKLNYVMASLMIPQHILHNIQSLIMKFIWRGRPPKVARDVLYQTVSEGGLGATSVQCLYEAFRLSWVVYLLKHESSSRAIFQQRVAPLTINNFLKTRFNEQVMEKCKLSEFYKDLLKRFKIMFPPKEPTSGEMVRKEIVWHNEKVMINNSPVFFLEMQQNGIMYLGDLITRNGKFLTYEQFCEKYNARIDLLRYQGLISAIPKIWKLKLLQHREPLEAMETREMHICCNIGMQEKEVAKLSTKELYRLGITNQKAKALLKWEAERLAPDSWEKYLEIPYQCCSSTQIQSFQFQVVHRFLPTKRFLHLRRIIDSQMCDYCGEIDTFAHHLYNCKPVHTFWIQLFRNVNRKIRPAYVTCDARTVLFGAVNVPLVVNLVILLAKRYVHVQRRNEKTFQIEQLRRQVEQWYEAEKIIALRGNTMDVLVAKWHYFRERNAIVL